MQRRILFVGSILLGLSLFATACTVSERPPLGGAPRTPVAAPTEESLDVGGLTASNKEELQKLMMKMKNAQGKPEDLIPLMQLTMGSMSGEMQQLKLGSGSNANSRLGERMDDIGGKMGEMAQMTPQFQQLPPQTRQEVQSLMERLARGMQSIHNNANSMTAEQRQATMSNLVLSTDTLSEAITYLSQDPATADPEKQQEYSDKLNSLKEALDQLDKGQK